jgi:peptide deformylase
VAIQPIRIFGDPVLRMKAQPVTTFDKELRNLVRDLTETMRDAPGSGLAAPQIGVSLRVFTYHVDGELGHLVNPTLDLTDEQQDGEEGCLSLPGLRAQTPRFDRAVVRGQDLTGAPVEIEGTGFFARCLQHETAHLDGGVFLDVLSGWRRLRALRAMRRAPWYVPAANGGGRA